MSVRVRFWWLFQFTIEMEHEKTIEKPPKKGNEELLFYAGVWKQHTTKSNRIEKKKKSVKRKHQENQQIEWART